MVDQTKPDYVKVALPRLYGKTYVGVGTSEDNITQWYEFAGNAQKTNFTLEPVQDARISGACHKLYDGHYSNGANPLLDALKDNGNFNLALADSAVQEGLIEGQPQDDLEAAVETRRNASLARVSRRESDAAPDIDQISRKQARNISGVVQDLATTGALFLGSTGAMAASKEVGDQTLGGKVLKWTSIIGFALTGVSVFTKVLEVLASRPVDEILFHTVKAAHVAADKVGEVGSKVANTVLPEQLRLSTEVDNIR